MIDADALVRELEGAAELAREAGRACVWRERRAELRGEEAAFRGIAEAIKAKFPPEGE